MLNRDHHGETLVRYILREAGVAYKRTAEINDPIDITREKKKKKGD